MAFSNKKNGNAPNKTKPPLVKMGALSYMWRSWKIKTLKGTGSVIKKIVIVIIILILMSGVVNQRNLFRSGMDFFLNTSKWIGEKLTDDKKDVPITVTDEGVYIDGKAPEGSKEIMPELEKEAENIKEKNGNAESNKNAESDKNAEESKGN